MQVLLLGPVTIVDGDEVRRVTSARQAALLTVLATFAGAVVSHDRLVEALWGGRPPATARNTLQVHVSALRRHLGPQLIRAEREGYVLDPAADVDATRFRVLTNEGRTMLDNDRPAEAARLLRAALALWRGDPLTDVDTDWAASERERLTQLWLLATTSRLDADLALGRHLQVLDELAGLCLQHPFHEDLAARRMLALYRAGRQADALDVYALTRLALRDDLGVDPGAELRALHDRVLRHDASLILPAGARAGQVPWRRPISVAADRLVGREGLVATVEERLANARLVTLVGPSGIGKTRVATEVARHCQATYAAGAVVVDAAGVDDTAGLLRRLGARLDATPAATDPLEVTGVLDSGEVLVVVDDVEPGSALAHELADLVVTTGATWLVTSPRPLGTPGEHVVTVPPLPAGDGTAPGPGIELLLSRAEAAGATIARDAETLCLAARAVELLDGLPLALELAAPAAVLGLDELVPRLERERAHGRYGVSVSFATSLDQLDRAERRVLGVLAVAETPVDLELLAAVDDRGPEAAGAVAALVRDGLVRRTPGPHGQALFDLAANVAVEARERLAGASRSTLARAMVDACVETFATEQYLCSQHRSADQARRWMALAPAGRRALDLAHELGLAEEYAAIAAAVHELIVEDTGVNPEALRAEWALADPSLTWQRRADLHHAMGVACLYLTDPAGSARHLDAALAIAEEHADLGRIAVTHVSRLTRHMTEGNWLEDVAKVVAEMHAAAHESGRAGVLSSTYAIPPLGLGLDCEALLREGLRHCRTEGFPGAEVLALANLAEVLLLRGELDEAARAALEAGALAADLHQPYHARAMAGTLETVRALQGSRPSLAAVAMVLHTAWEAGDLRTATDSLQKLAAGTWHRGDRELASQCVGLYEALLVDAAAVPAYTESEFARTWLDGCPSTMPQVPLDEAVAQLATAFRQE